MKNFWNSFGVFGIFSQQISRQQMSFLSKNQQSIRASKGKTT